MTTLQLRQEIKKAVDRMPKERLSTLADLVGFLTPPALPQRIQAAEKDLRAGKGVAWRKVRRDV